MAAGEGKTRAIGGCMEPMNQGPAEAVPPMTFEQFEAFYTTEYPKLVKILVLLDATIEEAEDAAQKAMAYIAERFMTTKAPDHPVSYVRMAATRFFVKERQRDRERLQREVRSGHPVLKAHLDDRLTNLEDKLYIEFLLERLTSTQQQVIRLVMDGLSTRDIAEKLCKSDETIRQHLKNGRDRLKLHPDIAPLASRQAQSLVQQRVRSPVTTPEPRKEEVQ
jgi:RNA polymerase sigma factor (sigma-70 family)